ncbi:hypothetical protein ABT56_08940 [Photobacterium aquae]|uniref:MSHA biogenesis protein MshA n=1 Tax=Photobacterium aquae TaxID=1195763 RepID=A0A0J1H2U2_9GAMM|nr:type II secretion system protein [Photobacterium aquae]KLV06164.1 hypothetical protein ABT56_08940 [Photobacterium aquae]
MKRQGGFTLIELVVVIVILGILAVTAAPRFLNLQGDARGSTLEGLKGAMNGATGIVFGKAAVKGLDQSPTADLIVDGKTMKLAFGYPDASKDGITNALKLDLYTAAVEGGAAEHKGEWQVQYDGTDAYYTLSAIKLASDIKSSTCYVKYTQATQTGEGDAKTTLEPVVKVEKSGC